MFKVSYPQYDHAQIYANTASCYAIESLRSNVFERRTSTGGELFPALIHLYATKFVLVNVFTLKVHFR